MGPPGARGLPHTHSNPSLRDRDDGYHPEERGFPAVSCLPVSVNVLRLGLGSRAALAWMAPVVSRDSALVCGACFPQMGGRGPPPAAQHSRYPSDGGGSFGGPRDRFRDYPDDDRPLANAALAGHDANDLDQTIGGESRDVDDFPGRGPSIKSDRADKPFPGDRGAPPRAAAAAAYTEDRPIKGAARAPDAAEENPFGTGKPAARGFPGAAAAASSAAGPGDEDDEEGGAFGGAAGGEAAEPEELAGVENAASLPGPAKLKPAVAKDFAREISVFGEYVVRCFHSTQWALREAALRKIDNDLSSYPVSKVGRRMRCCWCCHPLCVSLWS